MPIYVKYICKINTKLPGQHLQEVLETFSPWQSIPPQLGLGLVHVRHWSNTSPPQGSVQLVLLYHGVQPPSTKN